jgi:predicted Mrr-cat superfamily restriction endonuclease
MYSKEVVMMKIWIMKTAIKYYEEMIKEDAVMIDENGIDDYYHSYTEQQIKKIIESSGHSVGRIKGFFERFVDEMSLGDLIIIGTGQASKFNVTEIARITGDYKFDTDYRLRHYRSVEFYGLDRKIPFDQWRWAKRLDEVGEDRLGEFGEIMSKILI